MLKRPSKSLRGISARAHNTLELALLLLARYNRMAGVAGNKRHFKLDRLLVGHRVLALHANAIARRLVKRARCLFIHSVSTCDYNIYGTVSPLHTICLASANESNSGNSNIYVAVTTAR